MRVSETREPQFYHAPPSSIFLSSSWKNSEQVLDRTILPERGARSFVPDGLPWLRSALRSIV